MREENATMQRERELATLARQQYGVVTRAQLVELGFGSASVGRRVRTGRLVPLQRGVYAVGHAALRSEGRALAAQLACGPQAVLSHASAPEHLGLPRLASPVHDVTVSSGVHRRRPGIRIHRTGFLSPEEIAVRGPIRVTTLARTALDLAETGPARRVRRMLREAEVRRIFELDSLEEAIARHPTRTGASRLRRILSELPGTEPNDGLEASFLSFVRRHGLPEPEVHATVGPYEADFLWRAARVVVETDDFRTHSMRSSFEHLARRSAWFSARHYRILPVTARRLAEDPSGVDTDLREALGPTPP
jgi:very-short-patch-repair endonuclease/predicted transcriptional regulator of viral defense system